MVSPVGLDPWEVVALAGLSAATMLTVASVIGFTISWLVCREPAARPVSAPKPAAHPAPDRASEYATA